MASPSSSAWSASACRRALLFVALLTTIPLTGCLNDFEEQRLNRVWIGSIDVSAPRVTSGAVTLLVNVTLDNRDADSGDLMLRVKAHNTVTGLLEATKEVSAGRIDRDRTETVAVPLDLPKEDGYRITAVLFQDEQRLNQATVQVSKVEALRNNVFATALQIGGLEFLVRNVTDDRVRIEAQVYLTNEGANTSEPLRLQVKAREVGTGLLAAEQWSDVGSVPAGATHISEVGFEVPDAYNYLVDAVLWQGAYQLGAGQGKVQLLPTFTVPKDEEVVRDKPVVEDFVRDEGSAAGDSYNDEETPGPAVLVVVLALVATVAWIRRRS